MIPHRPPVQPPIYSAALRHARRQLCARLAHAAAEPDENFAQAYVELVAEVESHLRHEETVMEACGVKRLDERVHEQRQENAAVLAAMLPLYRRARPPLKSFRKAIMPDACSTCANSS